MRNKTDLLRLKAASNIRTGHIQVERHRFSAYPLHWHDYFEIEIITDGSGACRFNGERYPLSKGDAYLLTPLDFHEIEAGSPVELINISFDETLLSENMRAALYRANFSKLCKFEDERYDHFIKASQLLSHEYESQGPCVVQLLEYMLSRFLSQNPNASPCTGNQDQLAGIKNALEYIELHFRERITLEKLASISGYSPTYFSERFRKMTGENYLDRLTALRIDYAKGLLANGLSVTEACYASGFGSLSNFLAVFKKKCGLTPSEYRIKYKEAT